MRNTSLALVMPVGVFLSSAAYAQDAPPQGTDGTLGDIVVTATKKAHAEELQKVSIAVTAFGAAQIANTYANSITDIAQTVPNARLATVGSLPGVANFAIRGMGFNSSIASEEPTVGVIVDGVYLANNFGAVVDNFDLEAIEILRGPQGTLFGRNVTAGAVVIRTKRPTGDWGFDARVNVGNGGRMEVSAAVDAPLTDTLAARVSGSYKSLAGYFPNRALAGDNIASRSDFSVRPTLQWKPDSKTTVSLIGEYTRNRDGGATGIQLLTPGSGIQATGYVPPSLSDHVLDHDFRGFTNMNIYSATLEINREVGQGTLTSVTGFRKVRYSAAIDVDATPVSFFIQYAQVNQRQFSQELRYAGSAFGDSLEYTVGLYGFTQRLETAYDLYRVPSPASSFIAQGALNEVTAGAFAQAQWHFSDAWSATAGIRYNYDRKRVHLGHAFAPTGDCSLAANPIVICNLSFQDSKSWQDLSPKFGLNWQIDSNTLAYASVTRGFRSGGYNLRNYALTSPYGPYNPETVTSGELGFKKTLFDGRLRTNFAGFYSRYDDLLRTVVNTNAVTAILNAATATIWGLEFEGAVIPFRGLRLDGSVGYINASYQSFNGLDLTGDGISDPALAQQLRLERAPKWTWSIGGTYDFLKGPIGKFSLGANYSYTGSVPVNTANTFFLSSYKLLDASLRWQTADEHLTISVYGKNLTNEAYAVTGFVLNPAGRGIYLEPPRSYGVELRFNF